MSSGISSFLAAYAGQAAGFFGIVGLVFLVTWRWGASRLSSRRLHVRARRFDRSQWLHEVRHTLVVLALGTAQAVAVTSLHDRGQTALVDDLGAGGLPGAVLAVAGLVLFNDLWFYGVHRLLHTRWLFKHVHAVHHRSVDVNPFSSYSFHAVEALLLTGWIVPVALVVPLPLPVLIAVQVAGLANNIMAHLGYELLPAWWLRVPVLRWSNTATYHSLHHTRFNENYGLFTRLWDRAFGTELTEYEAAFVDAHASPAAHDPAGATASATAPRS